MRAVYGVGYSPTDPADPQVLISGYRAPSAANRAFIYSPGRGLGPDEAVRTRNTGIQRLADAGLGGMAGSFGGTTTYGNDTAIERIGEAWDWLPNQIACPTDKVLVIGESMGGCDVLNWVQRNLGVVAAVALMVPLVDLADVHDNNRGGLASEIETAYGGGAGYAAAVDAHNPLEFATDLAGIPIKIWNASNDTLIVPATVAAFAAASGAETVDMGAVGHSIQTLDPSAIYGFLRQYA